MSERLRFAAQAVLDRWNSPQWEWAKQGPTADLIADLARSLDEAGRVAGGLPVANDGRLKSLRPRSLLYAGASSSEQAIGLYAFQADEIRALLDARAPETHGNLQARVRQLIDSRMAERERCAKLCEDYAARHAKDSDETKAQAWMMLQCAAKIRKG